MAEPETEPEFKDWLVMRLWGRVSEGAEVCILTTRGYLLARHYRLHLRRGVHHKGINVWKKIPGLRRYKTEKRAEYKANQLNRIFKTNGYNAIREDLI